MDDRLGSIEKRLGMLEDALAEVRARLGRIETGSAGAVHPPEAHHAPAPSAGAAMAGLSGIPALVGRSCLILGGAFLLRYLTESGQLSQAIGVGLGIAYALVWIVFADRAAARGRHLGGAFHAFASALIAYPLVWEATLRFAILPPAGAAVLLAVATGVGLTVAWRRSFRTISWITILFAIATGIGLLFRTQAVLPFSAFLLALAVASFLLAYTKGWRGQRWLVAIAVDLTIALLTLVLLAERPPDWLDPRVVLAVQLGLVLVYLVNFAIRLYVLGRVVTSFAITQTLLVWCIGYEGAVRIGGPSTELALGIAGLAVAILAYAAVFGVVERRWGHGLASGYFSSVAALFAVEGMRLLLPGWAYPVAWAALAVALAGIAYPGRRWILQVHALLLGIASAVASGLTQIARSAFTGPAAGPWPAPATSPVLVLVLLVCAYALVHREVPALPHRWVAVVSRTGLLIAALLGVGGLAVSVLGASLASAPGPGADAGWLAVIRMGVIACAALVLAGAHAWTRRPEFLWLLYLVLALGGVKVLVEDLRLGRAATLIFSLGLYGAALILGPMIARLRRPDRQDP